MKKAIVKVCTLGIAVALAAGMVIAYRLYTCRH